MRELKHELLPTRHTQVFHEDKDKMEFNAPHHFVVVPAGSPLVDQQIHYGRGGNSKKVTVKDFAGKLATVNFQLGPVTEHGANGVMNEDLIAMVITRLQYFQNSEFNCRENAMAITKLEEALMWLNKRTAEREQRGVEGTHEK
ncbi:Tad1 [Bacillus phage SBSphiJ7]|uniref:Thoeris anti-defense 1 n=1 Tax=Bacillus phage SBSphiJ7 TaxID=2930344 RepID=TAD1_BPPSB|nr:RecName: Full=Thoeris anti-defense 1; Short=Tad1 [Bacillus phage SBSphiJ7]UPI13470.1 Tad1 [Bacillus phage SBSphiJ7]